MTRTLIYASALVGLVAGDQPLVQQIPAHVRQECIDQCQLDYDYETLSIEERRCVRQCAREWLLTNGATGCTATTVTMTETDTVTTTTTECKTETQTVTETCTETTTVTATPTTYTETHSGTVQPVEKPCDKEKEGSTTHAGSPTVQPSKKPCKKGQGNHHHGSHHSPSGATAPMGGQVTEGSIPTTGNGDSETEDEDEHYYDDSHQASALSSLSTVEAYGNGSERIVASLGAFVLALVALV